MIMLNQLQLLGVPTPFFLMLHIKFLICSSLWFYVIHWPFYCHFFVCSEAHRHTHPHTCVRPVSKHASQSIRMKSLSLASFWVCVNICMCVQVHTPTEATLTANDKECKFSCTHSITKYRRALELLMLFLYRTRLHKYEAVMWER